MRVFVMYDLPVVNKKDSIDANKFNAFLMKNGFYMIQESVYCCLARNDDFARKIIDKVSQNTPKKGDVRCFKITEEQYQNIHIFSGQKSTQELLTTMEKVIEI